MIINNLAQEFKDIARASNWQYNQARMFRDPHCANLNRYNDILAYADTCATVDGRPPNCFNYVNANFIPSPYDAKHRPVFIAAQAPKPVTLPSFMKLLFNYSIPLVLTILQHADLSKDVNTEKARVAFWLPIDANKIPNGFEVSSTSPKAYPGFDVRTVTLSPFGRKEESRSFYHLHLTEWPDHSVPSQKLANSLIWIFKIVRQFQRRNGSLAMVHCSAGIGRTGTLMAAYFAYDQYLNCREHKVSFNPRLFELVLQMRAYRPLLVQNEVQYIFLAAFMAQLPQIVDLY